MVESENTTDRTPQLAPGVRAGAGEAATTPALPVQLRESGRILMLRDAALASSAGAARWDASLPGEILGAAGAARGRWSVLAARAWRADALTKVAALAAGPARDELLARRGGRDRE